MTSTAIYNDSDSVDQTNTIEPTCQLVDVAGTQELSTNKITECSIRSQIHMPPAMVSSVRRRDNGNINEALASVM